MYGSAKYAVRIQLDPSALASRQIGIDEVANAISDQNVNLPTGVLNGPTKTYTVQANGQLQNAASFRRLVVAYRNGAPVHLGDLGQVLDDVQNNKSIAWFNGTRGVILADSAAAGHEHRRRRRRGEGADDEAAERRSRRASSIDTMYDRVGRRSASRCAT